jgi:hypothetical protein
MRRVRGIRSRDLGLWSGHQFSGIAGPPEGRFDRGFVLWCEEQGHLCVRTVDLFWVLECYEAGFPLRFSITNVRKRWQELKDAHQRCLRRDDFLWLQGNDSVPPSKVAIRDYADIWFPDPGPWVEFCAERKRHYIQELERYKRVLSFWKACGQEVKRCFLRCARYSERRAEAHPDYLVVFRASNGDPQAAGFVEVKSPREGLKPSQRRFFPELITQAQQRVWIARVDVETKNIKLFVMDCTGRVIACDPS